MPFNKVAPSDSSQNYFFLLHSLKIICCFLYANRNK